MENYCKEKNSLPTHTCICTLHIFVPIRIQQSTEVLFVTKHQHEFRFAAKSLQGFDSILKSAI